MDPQDIEKLNQELARLRDKERRAGLILAALSKELREPLNSVVGFSRILLRQAKGRLDDRQYKNLDFVHQSGKQLAEMLSEVDHLAQEGPTENTTFDVVALVRTLMAQFEPCPFEFEGPPELEVDRDQSQLGAALQHLLQRTVGLGLKSLKLEASEEELKFVFIWGEEEGEDELARIRRLLEHAKAGGKEQTLSLAVGKRLVRLLGGQLDVREGSLQLRI